MSVAGQKKHKLFEKRIPTLLGIGLLIVGLVVGTIVFSSGTGVFAPRATPETTPKNVKLSNITDQGFAVSFITDSPAIGYIKLGTEPNKLKIQVGDDRDQLYGTVDPYPLHHITANGLEPNTTYFFVIGTGGRDLFDNNGQPFSVKTGARLGAPPKATTLYGAVSTAQSTPAEGSIVYATLEGAGTLSQLVQKTGSWVISLSNARTTDGSSFATITDNTPLLILAQGHPASLTAVQDTTVSGFTNGTALILGSGDNQPPPVSNPTPTSPITPTTPTPTSSESAILTPTPTASESADLSPTPTATESSRISPTPSVVTGGGLSGLLADGADATTPSGNRIVNLEDKNDQVVDTANPLIKGQAAPNVTVVIRVNSETQIEQRVQANDDGEFYLDIEALSAELEPGEHTVEYSYIDPETGQEVTETRTFIVEAPQTASAQLAQANPTRTPTTYGTDYPYGTSPTPTQNPHATNSGTLTQTPTPTINFTSTDSATVSTQSSQTTTSGTLTEAGSVGTTLALLLGGFLFMLTGAWSFWVARELR